MAYTVSFFDKDDEQKWDEFVLNKSMNGTFLQTRKFINYHPEGKFKDCSLCVRKGNELVAVVLACEVEDDGKRTFFAHKGTTFGGITVSKSIYSASNVNELMEVLLDHLRSEGFEKAYIKMVPDIYQKSNSDLLDYFLYKNGFECYNELNYYLVLCRYKKFLTEPFSTSKRRDYRYSLRSGFGFRKLETQKEISAYYNILLMNLNKLGLLPVHSLEDLLDLKFNRFDDRIEFYGVYLDNQIVAGSMLFYFDKNIVHTQYLSSDQAYLKLYPMDFLIANLIRVALEKSMDYFTFGICTENQGKNINLGLSRFKEGFGTEFCINRSYEILL